MSASLLDKILVQLFSESKLPKEEAAMIFIQLETEEQQLYMAEFLYNNPEATPKEIAFEARKILHSKTTN